MAKIEKVKATDKEGNLIAEFDLELPESFDELGTIPGKEKALAYVVNQMKIVARAAYKGKPSILPKGSQTAIKSALEAGDISLDELMEFIKSRKSA